MNVYSFFYDTEHSEPNQTDMVRLWVRSWAARGWTPRILTIRNAAKHKSFSQFKHDYREWPRLAQEASGASWLCPVELLNFSFTHSVYRKSGPPKPCRYLSAGWDTAPCVDFSDVQCVSVIEHCGRPL